MIKKRPGIRMSETAMHQLMGTLSCSGKCLLPEAENDAAAFTAARSEWTQAGLIMEDFDGKMHPTPQFARMQYNLINLKAVLHFENAQQNLYFVRGPVDLLRIQRTEDGSWMLQRNPMSEALHWFEQELPLLEDGRVSVCSESSGQHAEDDMEQLAACGEKCAAEMQKYQHIFFKKGEDMDAGNSAGDD